MVSADVGHAHITVGVITSPHGVRGHFKVKSFTSDAKSVVDYGPVQLADGSELSLTIIGQAKGLLICTAPTITSRNDVEAVQGSELFVSRANLPDTDDDEVYQADLIGLRAVDAEALPLGSIIGFHDFGAGALVEVKPQKGQSFFTPFGGQYLGEIDLVAGTVEIFVPAGLLGEDDSDKSV